MKKLRVAIIGGGIGGLSTAVALHQMGAEVRVYEQARQLAEVGAGVGLHRNSQRVLDRLGLGDEVSRRGARLSEFHLFTQDGTVVSHEKYGAGAGQLGLHRADLVEVLAGALPTEVVHTGHRCVQFTQHGGSARVSFDNGAAVSADVVVAADGIHSRLQRDVVEPTDPVFSGVVAYRGLIPAERLPEWPKGLVTWGGDGKHLIAYPVRAGELINYVGFVPADEQMRESWSAPGDPTILAAAFADWTPQVRRLLSRVETTLKWGLYDREPLPRWTDGRLTLLGDAAHPMLPHMGQGANQAIEDALALAILLRGVPAADAPTALTRFQMLRRDHTARVQRSARVNGLRFDAAKPLSLNQSWVRDYDVEKEALAAS
ncbi:MAG: 2-polyprenyl-6-methoxyphenol hydroxylase [Mycobacterium sp.]|nr:2-polyprenyl-6-methoxyphenol hydroxylase [Mycobacterium sp.]